MNTKKPVQIRVVPFGSRGNYFVVEVNVGGWLGGRWRPIETAFIASDDPARCNCDHPLMFESFDDAVKRARAFTTFHDVQDFEASERAKYREAVAIKSAAKKARVSQSWSSEIP